jgi:hypothetical protein
VIGDKNGFSGIFSARVRDCNTCINILLPVVIIDFKNGFTVLALIIRTAKNNYEYRRSALNRK